MKSLLIIFLILGFFIFAAEELTGNAVRKSPIYAQAYPGCKSGCYYGSPMGLRENGKITLVSKNDFHFQCREPEKTGCLAEGTVISPLTFTGEFVHGVYECTNHFWEINPYYMSVPCPPQLAKLD